MSMIAKNRIHSAWTPLNNKETNNKIFEERIKLVKKWFIKWNDDQRKRLFEELVLVSQKKQLEHARELIDSRLPCSEDDFTRFLPRVITLYIFSFLDAHSLCRCSQVCWYWRYLTELDQLWMPKCLHFGWFLTFTPSPYENGVWKRNFAEQFQLIQAILPKHPPVSQMKKLKLDGKNSDKSMKVSKPQPWRGSDPVPRDTWRFNYLNNDEVLQQIAQLRQKKMYAELTEAIVKNAHSKINTGSNVNNTLTRSRSLTHVISDDMDTGRPRWALEATRSGSQFGHPASLKGSRGQTQITRAAPVSSFRPPPANSVRAAPSHKTSSRPSTARYLRTVDAFPQVPWNIPDHADSENEEKK
ncbi:hypothetical protein BsWGS_24612 [Bradybaena similaris]